MPEKPFKIVLSSSEEHHPLLTGPPQSCGMRSGRVTLKPGQSCGQHSTKAHEELLVFLRGRGQVVFERHPAIEVAGGEVVYIPPHTLHDVRSDGSDPLGYVYVVAPAGIADA